MFGFGIKPERRVAAGVKYLDEVKPGWVLQVDPDTLNLSSDSYCVLGQVYGRYGDAPAVATRYLGARARWAYRHGFLRSESWKYGVYEDQRALTAEWRRVLRQRRGAETLAA